MESIWIVNNIPTPYRLHFFKVLNEELEKRGGALFVSFMASTETGRHWDYMPGQDFGFPYSIHKGIHPYLFRLPMHFNAGILKRAALKKDEVTIVAGGWLYPSSFSVSLLRRSGLRLFWSESNVDSSRYSAFPVSMARRLILSRYDGYCVPNDRALEWLGFHVPGVDKKHIVKLPNLVNEDLFSREVKKRKVRKRELRRSYNINQNSLTLLCPARLLERKGIRAFLLALRESQFKKVTILIAGEGPDRAKLEEIGRSMSSIKTSFLGFCHEQQMLDLYALSDIFLLPSFEDPNPLGVIEACHAGLPLMISKKLGNYPEALKEGDNGWSFNPNDPSSIRDAFASAVNASRGDLERMGTFSSEIGQQNFNTRKAVQLFVNSLEKILNSKDR